MLPPDFKNRKHMERKPEGYPINHVKDEGTTADAFVVMVVIARRIMRKLLAVE